ncbi:siderophore-interacting protein [Nakamurella silvestris]|nr:siderophore-interacting protein [Nakamurella silvestris]
MLQREREFHVSQPEPKRRPAPISTTVLRTERLSESMVRVVVGGPELATFGEPVHADSYVKLMFLSPGVDYPRPIDVEQIRASMPQRHWPRLRTYTVRSFDRAAAEMAIDFVVHGDQGLAGPWAANTQPGDELLMLGPGGGYSPDPTADWHLLVGDESAVPAIAAALERIDPETPVQVFLEVYGPADGQRLPRHDDITWVHRGLRPVGEALVEAVTGCEFPSPAVDVFVHGEAGFVKQLRRHLRTEREVPMERMSISGYWRLGADDEAWRSVKREWNKEIEDEETASGSVR